MPLPMSIPILHDPRALSVFFTLQWEDLVPACFVASTHLHGQPLPAPSPSQAQSFPTPPASRLIFFCVTPQVERLHIQGVPVLAVKAAETQAVWWLLSDVSALCAEMTSRHHMQTGSSKQAKEKI